MCGLKRGYGSPFPSKGAAAAARATRPAVEGDFARTPRWNLPEMKVLARESASHVADP